MAGGWNGMSCKVPSTPSRSESLCCSSCAQLAGPGHTEPWALHLDPQPPPEKRLLRWSFSPGAQREGRGESQGSGDEAMAPSVGAAAGCWGGNPGGISGSPGWFEVSQCSFREMFVWFYPLAMPKRKALRKGAGGEPPKLFHIWNL